MKFNILDLLLPREIKFYTYLNQQAEVVLEISEFFKTFMENIHTMNENERKREIAKIKELEKKGDEIEKQIVDELNKTFITPFDREDIYTIAIHTDKAVDNVNRVAKKISMYSIAEVPADVHKFCEIIVELSKELRNLMDVLPTRKGASEIIRIMKSLESRGDDTFNQSMARLFTEQTPPLHIIKFKEIYELLEAVSDSIYYVAKLIRGVIIKLG